MSHTEKSLDIASALTQMQTRSVQPVDAPAAIMAWRVAQSYAPPGRFGLNTFLAVTA